MVCISPFLRARLALRFNLFLTEFQIFFLLNLSAVCTFWIVLICWCQKWFKKKNHWHVFRHEKLFEKQPLPHCQIPSKVAPVLSILVFDSSFMHEMNLFLSTSRNILITSNQWKSLRHQATLDPFIFARVYIYIYIFAYMYDSLTSRSI
jgi:hypothetical protein